MILEKTMLTEVIDFPETFTSFASSLSGQNRARYILRYNGVVSLNGGFGYANNSIYYVPDD
ncbi:hypothetical protein [Intestinibacter sp.]|uniref:hypothetical protein n=1 Tax=Intestinibacter sp. TaxID=1965304 RepID=UPI003F166106